MPYLFARPVLLSYTFTYKTASYFISAMIIRPVMPYITLGIRSEMHGLASNIFKRLRKCSYGICFLRGLSLIPKNVGPHPCKIKFSKITLNIGDESFETPDTKEWILLAPQGVGIKMPADHVNDVGVSKISEGRYRKNRVEVSFLMRTISMEGQYEEAKSFAYEIDVRGENPQALFRPEWSAYA